MDTTKELTAEKLRSLLDYSPETGIFTWRVRRRGTRGIGCSAGRVDDEGYNIICINYVNYRAHRLAWLYVYGTWPVAQIDHRNRIRSDNRIDNIRDTTPTGNAYNRGPARKSQTGRVGVGFHKGRIRAYVGPKHLGYFETVAEASAVRDLYVLENNLMGE